jgi:hypothetical protein
MKQHITRVLKVYPTYTGIAPQEHSIVATYSRQIRQWVSSYHDQNGNMIGHAVLAKTKELAIDAIRKQHDIQ